MTIKPNELIILDIVPMGQSPSPSVRALDRLDEAITRLRGVIAGNDLGRIDTEIAKRIEKTSDRVNACVKRAIEVLYTENPSEVSNDQET